MTAQKYFSVKEDPETLSSVILGDKKFVGYFLGELLKKQRIEIIENLNEGGTIKYVFCLWDGKEEIFEKGIELATRQKSKLLMLIPVDLPEIKNKILKQEKIQGIDFRFVLCGQIYGPRMQRRDFETLKNQQLLNGGLIFISDAVYGLSKAMFAPGTAGKTFSSVDWQLRINVEEGMKQTKTFFERDVELPIDKKVLVEKPRDEFLIKELKQEDKKIPQLSKETGERLTALLNSERKGVVKIKVKKDKSVFRSIGYWLLIFLLITMPIWGPAFFVARGIYGLSRTQTHLMAGNFTEAKLEASLSKKSLLLVEPVIAVYTSIVANIQPKLAQQIRQYLVISVNVANAGQELAVCSETAVNLFDDIFNKEKIPTEETKLLSTQLVTCSDKSYWNLSEVEILVNGTRLEKSMEMLPKLRQQLLAVKQMAGILPDILGTNQKKTYLVLLQNNSEIRPTGGFIGSYGLLTFEKGKLIDFEVKDVYWADGQLQGHVEPPADLKKNLGEANWYLRDSNWDPDFPTSAVRAAWFLEKETGRNVDGVVGVNLFVAQKILEAVGEINLTDFKENINAQNLFERAEYHAEINFFPGSTQKQDFLGSLSRALVESVKSVTGERRNNLVKSLDEVLTQKDLSLYFKNPVVEKVILENGWGGELRFSSCESWQQTNVKCVADNIMIVEANVGVNKANYFLKRNIDYQIELNDEGQLKKKVTINYNNTSQTEVFPAGRYKNYLRIYLPKEIVFESLKINEEQEAVVDITEDEEFTIVGALVEVPIMDKRIVEINYRLKQKMTEKQNKYLLMLQKQPGIIDEEMKLSFKVGNAYLIKSTQPEGIINGQEYVFSTRFDQDLFFDFEVLHP